MINGLSAGDFIKDLMGNITNQAIDPINGLVGPRFTRLGITSNQRKFLNKISMLKEWTLKFIRKRI